MFTSKLHILADTKLKTLKDIGDSTKVILGTEGSGTAELAKMVLDHNGTTGDRKFAQSFEEARERFEKEEVQVVFLLAGTPIDFIKNLHRNKPFHLLSVPFDKGFTQKTLSEIMIIFYECSPTTSLRKTGASFSR